jgi:periplasmic divalent cation tolerance protein
MTDEVVEVVITAPDEKWLVAFTRTLVERRLAAAGHNIAGMRSIYRWQGRIYDQLEARVALHTRASLIQAIVQLTKDQHPYEVPCVAVLPIADGNPAYIQWILDETAEG